MIGVTLAEKSDQKSVSAIYCFSYRSKGKRAILLFVVYASGYHFAFIWHEPKNII